MTSAKLGAFVTTGLVAIYLVLVAEQSFALIMGAEPVGVAIGYLMLVIPAVGIWGIVMELRFGLKIERLGKILEEEKAWPEFQFEYRPSGRPTKESAQAQFQKYRELAESDSENWRSWFSLGLIYDAAGDRPRARLAMRKALGLFDGASKE